MWDKETILKNFENDAFLVKTANDQRMKLSSSPEQSEFRVYCLLIVQLKDNVILIEGSNAEQGYIGGNYLCSIINQIYLLYFRSYLC